MLLFLQIAIEMGLFQQTIVKKHLQNLNTALIEQLWLNYQKHFHNLTIQENIRNSKEEQYQGEFLIDLFVNILGYTKNPTPNFNLTTEYKNVKDSKKADGAIVIDDKVRAVIELKGTSTTDLGKIETQAFGYKNNQPDCTYVVTSNFEKLRFYIDNAIEHIEFNLFHLTKEEFELLYLCLSFESIKNNIPKIIKEQSVSEEDVITKKLYKDYSLFKRELFANMVELNPEFDPLELFKKSQKLLDRFLFIFFAEDRFLLPTNLIFRINKEWQQLQQMRIQVSLYDRYKTYFEDLNSGAKVQLPAFSQTNGVDKEEHQIFAYNGGLFKEDEVLNKIKIDDAVLFKHTEKLSNYDFASEVDVNILGHIFENSLNELDEIKAQLEGQEIDKTKTKRKKDGVFYTPKYITKYIVENTIGKLCEEKKLELAINEEDYSSDKKRQKKTIKDLVDKLDTYRKWLLQLTICDPACGSGAFLNQALDFLIEEHQYIDELQAKLFGDALVLSDFSTSILENNLFGVDLNEESVEIAKLSLWLRTAQPNRKLNDLSGNIKCGNSLIDAVEIAGEKAFNWQNTFPKVFEKGGFDVIIGNPPYLNLTKGNTPDEVIAFYTENYFSIKKANSKNLFTLFNELGTFIIKEKGVVSFIIPEGFLKTRSYDDCVKKMNEVGTINKAVYFENWVFEDATTGSMIFEFIKDKGESIVFEEYLMNKSNEISKIDLKINPIIEKYNKLKFQNISELCDTFKGMAVQNRQDYIFKEKNELPNRFLLGNCIDRYSYKDEFFCDYSTLKIVGGTKNKDKHDISPRILIRRTGNYLCCVMLNEPALTESTLYSCSLKSDNLEIYYLLSILNSKFLTYIVRQNMITNEQAFPQIMMSDIQLLKIPIPKLEIQNELKKLAKFLELKLSELQEQSQKFQRTLQRKFELESLPKKLESWYELTFAEFVKELSKKKIKLSLSEEAEWEDYFLQEQQKALALKQQITTTDQEIDKMVYELYGLTDEEIEIVELS